MFEYLFVIDMIIIVYLMMMILYFTQINIRERITNFWKIRNNLELLYVFKLLTKTKL